MEFHLLSFVFGLLLGLALRELMFRINHFIKTNTLEELKMPSNSNIIAVAVTTVWVLSMLVELSGTEYTTSPLVHGLMGVIAGFYFKPFKGDKDEK